MARNKALLPETVPGALCAHRAGDWCDGTSVRGVCAPYIFAKSVRADGSFLGGFGLCLKASLLPPSHLSPRDAFSRSPVAPFLHVQWAQGLSEDGCCFDGRAFLSKWLRCHWVSVGKSFWGHRMKCLKFAAANRWWGSSASKRAHSSGRSGWLPGSLVAITGPRHTPCVTPGVPAGREAWHHQWSSVWQTSCRPRVVPEQEVVTAQRLVRRVPGP